jgi:hypothetical protein
MNRLDAEDDVHILRADFNALHQQTDQLTALLPVRCGETILHALGKLPEPPKDE